MKISGFGAREVYSAYTRDGKAAEEKTASAVSGTEQSADRVELSDTAQAAAAVPAAKEEDPSARAARVADIQRRVQSGDYHVSADTVAKSLLGGQMDRQA